MFLLISVFLQMLEHWIAHRRAMTSTQQIHSAKQPSLANVSSNASQAIDQGITKLHALRQSAAAHRMGSPSSNSLKSQSSTPTPSAEPIKSEEEKEWYEQENDLVIIKDKFEKYICHRVLEGAKANVLNLDLHWEVSMNHLIDHVILLQ